MRPTIGNTVSVAFPAFGGKSIEAKVDTGATSASLHATDIHVDGQRKTVTFSCPSLSENAITLDIHSTQDVSSADGGVNERPAVSLDIEIGGVSLSKQVFNLNDRSEMDSHVLLGQNILQAGQFVIDPSASPKEEITESTKDRATIIYDAIQDLLKVKCSLLEFTNALNALKSE